MHLKNAKEIKHAMSAIHTQ